MTTALTRTSLTASKGLALELGKCDTPARKPYLLVLDLETALKKYAAGSPRELDAFASEHLPKLQTGTTGRVDLWRAVERAQKITCSVGLQPEGPGLMAQFTFWNGHRRLWMLRTKAEGRQIRDIDHVTVAGM
jgi:hypothetical protein